MPCRVFQEWNEGSESYLINHAHILAFKDNDGQPLVEKIRYGTKRHRQMDRGQLRTWDSITLIAEAASDGVRSMMSAPCRSQIKGPRPA
jgi:hypothetical protein